MAGYSGTPLVRKLGIKDDHVVFLDGAPDGLDLAGPAGTTAVVVGMTGPGLSVPTSTAPEVGAGDSVIGLVGATVSCADVRTDAEYGLEATVTSGGTVASAVSPLRGRLGASWSALLARACPRAPAG